jgi:hypothetical protein
VRLWLSSICAVARELHETCFCHLSFELPAIHPETESGFKRWLYIGFPS